MTTNWVRDYFDPDHEAVLVTVEAPGGRPIHTVIFAPVSGELGDWPEPVFEKFLEDVVDGLKNARVLPTKGETP